MITLSNCCNQPIQVRSLGVQLQGERGRLVRVVPSCKRCGRGVAEEAFIGVNRLGQPFTLVAEDLQEKLTGIKKTVADVRGLGRALEAVAARYGEQALRELNVWAILHEFKAMEAGEGTLEDVAAKELERLATMLKRSLQRLEKEEQDRKQREQWRGQEIEVRP